MCDLIERHDAFGRAMMADLTAPGSPRMGVDGDFGGPATHVWSGGREAAQRPAERVRSGEQVRRDGRAACWRLLAADIEGTYAAATAVLAAAGPLPLASAEPWVEGDEAYARRLMPRYYSPSDNALWARWAAGEDLDSLGRSLGLPRARVVPVTTPQRTEETRP